MAPTESSQSAADPRKRRRAHHKSRKGCLECKRRHIKCDEQRPTCVNCVTSDRACHYAISPRASLPPAVPRDSVSPSGSSAGAPTPPAAPIPLPTLAATSPDSALLPALLQSVDRDDSHRFTFQHLLLLHHIESGMRDWLWVTEPIRSTTTLYLNGALASPFVMDELLAISAQHLSTTHPSLCEPYRRLGLDLQTRALAGFKLATDDPSPQSLVGRFLFSSLVALFTMASMAASSYHDFGDLVARFVEYLRVTRGVRIVGDGVWNELYGSEMGEIMRSFGNYEAHDEPLPPFLSGVAQMLQRSDLDAAEVQTCAEAARALGFIQKQLESPTSWGVHAVMAWTSFVSPAYTQLLADRKPEALVVLAHYAILLHRHRRFWVFQDLGERSIAGITHSVAPEWLPYLAKPIEALSVPG